MWKVRVDGARLLEVMAHIVHNALKAMAEGGELAFETKNLEVAEGASKPASEMESGQYVRMTVSDTGRGMAPEVVERAFDPFFSTEQLADAPGLGLSLAFGFIRRTGGHILIESQAGVGTKVRIYLPRANPDG